MSIVSQRPGRAAIATPQAHLARAPRVVIVGAGVGGLAAAVDLAAKGIEVLVLERADTPGGKLREIEVAGACIDAGPTVLTMRWVFDELFAAAGETLERHVRLDRLHILARHAWSERERLDLFADRERTRDAIGDFAGAAEAQRFEEFARRAQHIYRTLEAPFMRAQRPSMAALVGRMGWQGFGDLLRIRAFETLWNALGHYFRDLRVRQLFARYSTYCGSSPFAAPATMMLIAHVEQEGVWAVSGGMRQIAVALAKVASACGATLRFGSHVRAVTTAAGRVSGVTLSTGEHIAATAVVVNADASAIGAGLLGSSIAPAANAVPRERRSLSAVTWNLCTPTHGFPLVRHNVFFSRDYEAEFAQILRQRALPAEPTVYVCAQDRHDEAGTPSTESQRLFCLVNAPADGDLHDGNSRENEQCAERTFKQLERCGLTICRTPATTRMTTPADFNRLYPGTGGALYGAATHGWQASFRRPSARTELPGLYLAGGSVHPGPGLPMATLSGRLAAHCLMADLDLISRSRSVAICGGTSMR
jgi:1-hydroxycarotenoid 3,4-desaturase